MQLGELAGYIQETMESYEVEVNGKTYPGNVVLGLIQMLKLNDLSL
jgi:methionyl aminopeptidase